MRGEREKEKEKKKERNTSCCAANSLQQQLMSCFQVTIATWHEQVLIKK